MNDNNGTIDLARKEIKRVTLISVLLGFFLFVIKLIGGIIGSSQAVIADAVHSLTDLVTDLAVFVGFKYWSHPADENHPYGHGKIEAVVTIFIGVMLIVIGIGIGVNAIDQIGKGKVSAPDWAAFVVAVISIVVKEKFYRFTLKAGRRIRSRALIANAWHHRTDALGSIPVAVAVALAMVYPSLAFLDLIAAVVVSVFILVAAWKILKPAFEEIIDTGVSEDVYLEIKTIGKGVEGVITVHDIRTRRIGVGFHLDLHLDVQRDLTVYEGHEIAEAVRIQLHNRFQDLLSVLIHVDPSEENKMTD